MASKIKTIETSRFLGNDHLNAIYGGGDCEKNKYLSCPTNTLYETCSAPILLFTNCIGFESKPCVAHIICTDYYATCGVSPQSKLICGGTELYDNNPD